MTNIAHLKDRAAVRVSGDDAAKFLQGLVTSDVDRVGPDTAIHTSLLTPQGKILFEFFVARDGEGFVLDCPADTAAELAKRLTFYKLRAAVELSVAEDASVWAVWDGTPPVGEGVIIFPDPRLPELGHRCIVQEDGTPFAGETGAVDAAAYHDHRIGLGVAEGGQDFDLGDAFPHEANFDQLGSVDFEKGCFVGQEVVSRMQHRGTARKRVVPVQGDTDLPPSGTEIVAGETPLGTLGSTSGTQGLALLRLDRAEKALAKGDTISAAGVSLSLAQPVWADFQVPGSQGEDTV